MTFYRGKRVLVAGGTGLIGRELTAMLVEAGARVRVVSLDDPVLCPEGVEFVQGNLVFWETCLAAVRDMELVFNLAGIKGSVGIGVAKAATFMVPHLLFNTHLMEAARQRGVEGYLYTSSIAVYPPAEVFREDDAFRGVPDDTDRYAAYAKRVGELQAEACAHEYGWKKTVIVRPANVYGPGDNFDPKTAMVIPALISRIAAGEDPLVVWGDGSAVRDFIHARDCARGMATAMERQIFLRPLNLGSGRGHTIREVVETLCRVSARPPRVRWDAAKATGATKRVMDISRARELMSFEPRIPLEGGLRETTKWYAAHREKGGLRYNSFGAVS